MPAKRKVCFTGPMRVNVAEQTLRHAGCELVLGKPQDDFRKFRYERKDLVNLVGDAQLSFHLDAMLSVRKFWTPVRISKPS